MTHTLILPYRKNHLIIVAKAFNRTVANCSILERPLACYFPVIIIDNLINLESAAWYSLYFSDGMARTGVFIAAMSEVERVKAEGEIDLFQTVKAARSKRPHMVSTPVS